MSDSIKKKILLAEDDDSMRRLLEVILQKEGFEVSSAEDGLRAMKVALENEIDAVIADAVMPNLTGYELCRFLRGNAAKKELPIIVLSGLGQNNSSEAENCRADVFLMKDAGLKENLLEALAKLLP